MIGNSVTIVGNLTSDPELRFTNSGKGVASFSVAVNRRWTGQDGSDQEETSFFDIVAWDRLGENVAETLGKGDRVIVDGRLSQRSWETDAGEKRYKIEIQADEVAPSLRWATARLSRNEKDAGGGTKPQAKRPKPSQDYDEEPF